MHIVLYHDALIPPPRYGGIERVIYWLGKGLLELGHRVTLIARPGSQIAGAEFRPLTTQGSLVPLIPSDADLIHLSATHHEKLPIPFLITIHGNGRPSEKFHSNTVFISRKHAENHGSTHFVYNGIDPDEYNCSVDRKGYLAYLAKASWKVKNLKGAVEVARVAGLRLEVMGNRSRWWPPFGRVHYHGMVNDSEKREILSRARGFLFPVRWHEPFGIAVLEALASGCPVFGTPYGSLPEIVTPDVGGLSASASELARAVLSQSFSAEKCRQRVIDHFTHLHMAKKYVEYYEKILKTGEIESGHQPRSTFQGSAEKLLPWNS